MFMNAKNKKWILLIFGLVEAIIAVVCFSRGILNLWNTNGSVIKILIPIGILIALIAGYILMSMWYLREPKQVMMDENENHSYSELQNVLSSYTNGKYFGKIAKTVMEQLERLNTSCERTKEAINKRFDRSSLSYEKYYSIVDVAEKTANQNVVAMTNRMKFFDEEEYARLENYRNDNIPDDIQEKQIALYKENQAKIEGAIAVNENLILKMDTLSMELAKISNSSEADMETMLGEIEELTKENAHSLYFAMWNKYNLGYIRDKDLAFVINDYMINTYDHKVAKRIQRILNQNGENLATDGIFGAKTIEAIHRTNKEWLIEQILIDRYNNFRENVARDYSQINNYKGWINRLNKIAEIVGSKLRFSNEY